MCPTDVLLETPLERADVTRLTRKQAEKVAGVSRATLARYVADGTLSVKKDDQGHNVYDASELARVFADTFNLGRLETPESGDTLSHGETAAETPRDSTLSAVLTVEKRYLIEERDRLREELQKAERRLADQERSAADERAEFMKLLSQKEDTLRLLADQRPKDAPAEPVAEKPRGFFSWLRGGN